MVDLLRAITGESIPAKYSVEDPIRGELFGVQRLEQYAQRLASEHRIIKKKGARLLPRLEDNGRKLVAVYRALVEAVRKGESMSPAAEWLLDNFHIVEEQLREIREDLPKSYYKELPKLADGEVVDFPRIYVVALGLIAHTDSRLDPATLRRFITAYQSVSALTIGELWAVAISLRLALVENLRRLATQIVLWRAEKDDADRFADKLLELTAKQAFDPVALVANRFERWDRVHRAFLVQLTRRLRNQDISITPVFDWIEAQLLQQGTSIEQVMHGEHQRQAAAQVTIGNIITSMRLLSTLDWRDFFENVSLIEPILGQDPADAYAKMEFASRDRYRHVIEKISKNTNASEIEVARATVSLARDAARQTPDNAYASTAHVGFYLVDDGRAALEKAFNYRPPIGEQVQRAILRHPTISYLGTLMLLTALIVTYLALMLVRVGGSWQLLIALVFLALLPAGDLAVNILAFDITHLFEPQPWLRMDTSRGVPASARTLVAISTVFSSVEVVEKMLEKLELSFLANDDEHIDFVLLSDFPDGPASEMPEDQALIDAALSGVARLNASHRRSRNEVISGDQNDAQPRFYLFHRRRLWNPAEGKWMGWERKRGKLQEFNRLLRGATDTSFIVRAGDLSRLADVQFVITLDSDTQLPRDVARRLVGTAIHPLNRPVIDSTVNRVTRGYGILQPRVSVSLLSSCESRFAGIFSGNTGIDPYTTAVSDVYQDLFGEGSYTGKGLYHIDSFEQTLATRVPENALLSHDLFESLFARAALVTDIELLDDYPAHYDTYAKRQHRWTRGDWQVAPWLRTYARDEHDRKTRIGLPLVSRWKVFDNLRRSLTAPAIVLWLLATWTIFPGSPWKWSLVVLVMMAFPAYLHVTTGVMTHPHGIPWTSQFWNLWGDLRSNTAQFALTFIFIAHQACLMADAIIRVLYRRFISHRHLLEWVTAADAEKSSRHDLRAMLRLMWAVFPLSLGAMTLILWLRPVAIIDAAPFLAAWLFSPVVAAWVSNKAERLRVELQPAELRFARLLARRTWRFFEQFVVAEDNWLPPDSFQEDPAPVIAHRTSPTNIGLFLTAAVAAHDLGYVGAHEVVERAELTFSTLAKLPKFRGHFFNWYDTNTLTPLLPQYISTVDSGNLAGHLIALKQFAIELQDKQVFGEQTVRGLVDTLEMISEESIRLGTIRQRTEVITIRHLREEIETCKRLVAAPAPHTIPAWAALFDALSRRAGTIEDIVGALILEHGAASFTDLSWWIDSFRHQLRGLRRDLTTLLPWAEVKSFELEGLIQRVGLRAQDRWNAIKILIGQNLPISQLPQRCDQLMVELAALQGEVEAFYQRPVDVSGADDLRELAARIQNASGAATDLLGRLRAVAQTCDTIFHEMDFSFLLDKDRELFIIGYNVGELKPDNSYYDLLASEARLASFIAIAKGDVPQEHWFRLGRQLTLIDRARALISWNGTMFEYLMPLLVMHSYRETLLDQTHRAIVKRQIEYGAERGVPWGISESAYHARDVNLNYQYGSFGVPGLGLKRGLVQDLVVAPYATLLAASVDPAAAVSNLYHLRHEGALGRYGYYEAIDYTSDRVPQNQKSVLIRAFMAHHQGMSLVALDNVLNHGQMKERFHADALIRATDLLLQERIPQGVPAFRPRAEEVLIGRVAPDIAGTFSRIYRSADQLTPRTQMLTNGNYHVMLTAAGSGYSQCADRAVTRWREDVTRDNCGTFIYLRDISSGMVWSAGQQPVPRKPQSYEVTFAEDKADFWRVDSGFVTHTQIVVSPEENAEVRQVTITNNSNRTIEIELTSYAEVVLAPPAADAAHPAFGNLFIETEFLHPHDALLAHRRQYSSSETPIWGVHLVLAESGMIGSVQYETDRGRFLGRGHSVSDPVAVMEERPLSNTIGAVLDPVLSLRCRVRLKQNESTRVTFTTAVAQSREEAITLADKYHDPNTFERQSRLAWTRAQVEMSHLGIGPEDAQLFQKLGERVIYSDAASRPRSHVLALNTRSQSALWPYGISGDLPIVLVRVAKTEDSRSVRQIIRAHEYLHYKGLLIDLVILNDHPPSYVQSLQDEMQSLVRTSGLTGLQDKPGGVYLRRADLMPDEDRILLHAVARVVIVTELGWLEDQIERRPVEENLPPLFTARLPERAYPPDTFSNTPELTFFNGLGGFVQDGREYVTVLGEGQWTPAPWSNVIANNPEFGFMVTESGGGYTWSMNSRENRLTPWSNDSVSDPPGEILYLRDEETGAVWSPTPLPIREAEIYTIRHGQGYTVFEHSSHGISQELLLFAAMEDPVKVSLLRVRNTTDKKRHISVTAYNELVLGVLRNQSAPYIVTELDEGVIYARNPYNNEFAGRVAFAASSGNVTSATCDRKEFIGRNGTMERPSALQRTKLSGRSGAGLDPCAALQVSVELQPGDAREFVFLLGEADSKETASKLVAQYRETNFVNQAFDRVLSYWDQLLGTVEVKTPDVALNLMLNRWLVYQTLSCRVQARTAFYQSAGAFGFRDQLQDVMALLYGDPATARDQILRAAHRQFKEGDVQHWWHPPTGRGVRTKFSDDLLWLPLVVAGYISVTGDKSLLDEDVPFLEAPLLGPDEHEIYLQPTVSEESGSVFEHCLRALNRSLTVGAHGLPLMGAGDWNDGMNRVGYLGKGESVWLAWFLYTTLKGFIPFCEERDRGDLVDRYSAHMDRLVQALDKNGWDGDWYRRAYFDDGTPLGSAQNDECRIDSIAQSWGVISGAAEPHRAARAMAAVDEYLIRRGDGIVLLFTPPFDRGELDPGYLKGYAPGVRENGGQYTHAAIWTMIAFAMLGDGDRSGELFSLLNPINHSSTRAGLHKYKVEPYVCAGDVYAVPPHTGRGGWTWYTGSAGWMYRAGLESILGFKLRPGHLRIDPCIPRWWRSFEIAYRHGQATYRIVVENPLSVSRGLVSVEVDGVLSPNNDISLIDAPQVYQVRIVLGDKALIPEPKTLPAVDKGLTLAGFLDNLRANSTHALAEIPARIQELHGLESLPSEPRGAIKSLNRAAQYFAQHSLMRDPALKAKSLDEALSDIDKVQQSLKFMRGNAAVQFQEIVDSWLSLIRPIRYELHVERVFSISNPFNFSKPIIPKRNSETNVFSGRRDIIGQIEANILGANEPPTLLLHGPRRIGKTSILYQLPVLLGPDFACAIIDLQSSDTTESLEGLLHHISRAISKSLKQQVSVPRLKRDLKAQPFAIFMEWLLRMEQGLPEQMRILLCFDEYEKFQDVIEHDWIRKFLDTLRSIIQHHPRLVVMFTGVKTLEDLGHGWVGRFINAKYLRVSFLTFEEVRPLLQHPTADFGITYQDEALQALFAATRGQPFLTQAVAFELFNVLRRQKDINATVKDVENAVGLAFTSGNAYFENLWEDVREGGQSILRAIATGTSLPNDHEAIHLLLQNDVITADLTFEVPMVERWVKRKVKQ